MADSDYHYSMFHLSLTQRSLPLLFPLSAVQQIPNRNEDRKKSLWIIKTDGKIVASSYIVDERTNERTNDILL